MSVTIFEAGIEEMATQPNGAVAHACNALAQQFAEDARATLGVQKSGNYPNPAPGPPRRRSGDLQRSIKVAPPEIDSEGLVVYVISDASIANHGDPRGPYYTRWLLDHGYKFLSFELPETFH